MIISETNPGVDGTATAWVTTNKVWQDGETNPAVGTTTSTTYQSPDGLTTSVQQLGVTGRSISTTTLPGGGDWTVKNERPDGSYTLSTYVDGLMDKTENFKSNDNLVSSTTIRDNTGTVGSGYDSLKRVTETDDSRTGVTATVYKSATSDSVHSVTDPGSRTTSFNYDAMGRRTTVDAPNTLDADGNTLTNITNTLYNPDGTVDEVNGDQTYRRTYTYDYADRMVTMTTYGTQTATTTWVYSPDRGFLTRKEYDDGKGTDYRYTDADRLSKRICLWCQAPVSLTSSGFLNKSALNEEG